METTHISDELRRGRNKLAATVVLGHAVKHVYNSGLQAILLPEIKIGLGLNATQFGSLAFSRQVTGWVTTAGAGYLGDRFANRAALMLGISLALMGVSYFVAGTANSYWLMFASMLLIGIGPSLYHPPAIGALSRRFPDKRGFAISLHGTGGSVGEVLGPVITASVLGVLIWQDVLRASLFPALLAAFTVWILMRGIPGDPPGSSSTRAYLQSLASLLKKRRLLALVILATALRSMGQSSVMTFLPVYLREDLEFSATRVAIYLSMGQIVGIVAQPAMGFLSDRLGRKSVIVPAMTALGLLVIGLAYADTGIQLTLAILAMGAFLYPLHTIFIAAAMDIAEGEIQSTVVSLIYGASFLGTVSPVIAGVIADSYGVTMTFLYGGALILVAALVFAVLRLPKTATQLSGDRPQTQGTATSRAHNRRTGI